MRIAIAAGKRWHVLRLQSGLVALGHDVESFLAVPPRAAEIEPHTWIRPHYIPQGLSGRVPPLATGLNYAYGRSALKRTRGADLVIAWSSFALPFLQAGVPTIVVRGSHHIRRQREILDSFGLFEKPTRLQVWLEEKEYALANNVTVPTREIAADPYWPRGGQGVSVSPYGFPPILRRTQRSTEGLRLLFVGQLGYRKGLDRLINALGARPDGVASFELCGHRSRETVNISLPEWWTERGALGHPDLMELMTRSDVLLLPSREEGMAISGLEALAAGMALVATPESGLGQWIRAGCGVLVDQPDDPYMLREAVLQACANRESFGRQAQVVAGSWDWVDHARSVLSGAGLS